jgi:hypothetical protein
MLLYREAVGQLSWGTAFVLFTVMSLGSNICDDIETATCSSEEYCPTCNVSLPFMSELIIPA